MFGWFKKKKKESDPTPPVDDGPKVKVTFEDDDVTVDVSVGALLPDVCDEQGLSLGFGCREGGCGTCMIEVLEGMENLSARNESEDEMLEIMADGNPNARLACQCEVKGDVRFRTLDM